MSGQRPEVLTDGRKIWVNRGGHCVARICPVSSEIFAPFGSPDDYLFHEQIDTESALVRESQWHRWRTRVHLHVDVRIDPDLRPAWIFTYPATPSPPEVPMQPARSIPDILDFLFYGRPERPAPSLPAPRPPVARTNRILDHQLRVIFADARFMQGGYGDAETADDRRRQISVVEAEVRARLGLPKA